MSLTKPKLPQSKTLVNKSPPTTGKSKGLIGVHQVKDFFNYTPLRQNKSLSNSTQDLSINKSMQREATAKSILTQKKNILDQSDILHQKLREFKKKINSQVLKKKEAVISFTPRGLVLEKVLEKADLWIMQKNKNAIFAMIREMQRKELREIEGFRERSVKKKCLLALNLFKKNKEKADVHYEINLKVKAFLKWSTRILSGKSSTSVQTNDSNAENLAIFHEDDSKSELFMLAGIFYTSSLIHFKGFRPWRTFVYQRKAEKRLEIVAQENFKCKTLRKVFNALQKYCLDATEKPKAFRKISLLQKCINGLKGTRKVKSKKVLKFTKIYSEV